MCNYIGKSSPAKTTFKSQKKVERERECTKRWAGGERVKIKKGKKQKQKFNRQGDWTFTVHPLPPALAGIFCPQTDGSSSPAHHRARTCAIAFTQPRHRTPVPTPPPAAFDDRARAAELLLPLLHPHHRRFSAAPDCSRPSPDTPHR